MAKVIFDDGIRSMEDAGDKDEWGRKLYCSYFLGVFQCYCWRRTKKELAEVSKGFSAEYAFREWIDCPLANVAGLATT